MATKLSKLYSFFLFLAKEAIMQFAQNNMVDCLAICREVIARATQHNSGNWPFLLTKAFYIISAIHRQAENFALADEYMENSTEVLYLYHFTMLRAVVETISEI